METITLLLGIAGVAGTFLGVIRVIPPWPSFVGSVAGLAAFVLAVIEAIRRARELKSVLRKVALDGQSHLIVQASDSKIKTGIILGIISMFLTLINAAPLF